mgnify:CR=1 FL=1|jgi:hypothetical protein
MFEKPSGTSIQQDIKKLSDTTDFYKVRTLAEEKHFDTLL